MCKVYAFYSLKFHCEAINAYEPMPFLLYEVTTWHDRVSKAWKSGDVLQTLYPDTLSDRQGTFQEVLILELCMCFFIFCLVGYQNFSFHCFYRMWNC